MPPLAAALLVGVGGSLGAVGRYAVASRLEPSGLPVGTLSVNVLGTFALGLVVFGGVGSRAALLLGTGFCGAFTTFSSFSVDTVELWADGRRKHAAGYAVGTLALAAAGLGLAWLVAYGLRAIVR
jgi:CrcB protein